MFRLAADYFYPQHSPKPVSKFLPIRKLLIVKKYDQAFMEAAEMLRNYPHDSDAYYYHALCLTRLNRFKEAEKDFETAIQKNSSNEARCRLGLGLLYEKSDQEPKAKQQYQRAIELNKSHNEPSQRLTACKAAVKLGLLHKKNKNFIAAMQMFHEASRIDFTYYPLHYGAFDALMMQGKFKQALGYADRMQSIVNHDMPGITTPLYNFCIAKNRAYMALGKIDLAINECNKAIDLLPHEAKGYFHRGVAKLADETRGSPVKDFEEAVKLDAQSEAKAWLGYALYSQIQKNLEGAKELLEAIESVPEIKSEYQFLFKGIVLKSDADLMHVWREAGRDSVPRIYSGILLLRNNLKSTAIKDELQEYAKKPAVTADEALIKALIRIEFAENPMVGEMQCLKLIENHLPRAISPYLRHEYFRLMLKFNFIRIDVYDLDICKTQLVQMICEIRDVNLRVQAMVNAISPVTSIGSVLAIPRKGETALLDKGRRSILAEMLNAHLTFEDQQITLNNKSVTARKFYYGGTSLDESTAKAITLMLNNVTLSKELLGSSFKNLQAMLEKQSIYIQGHTLLEQNKTLVAEAYTDTPSIRR